MTLDRFGSRQGWHHKFDSQMEWERSEGHEEGTFDHRYALARTGFGDRAPNEGEVHMGQGAQRKLID
jgi:hypothetical protein